MAFAICRISKLKGSKMRAAQNHNARVDMPENANPQAFHQRLVGEEGKDIEQLFTERKEATNAKIRADGVPVIEMMLSASPEYFRPGKPEAYGQYDAKRTEAWLKKTRAFLNEKYGDNLIVLDLHCDEATPHVHAMITPIIEKTRKKRGKDEYYKANSFDASVMFSRKELGKLQDEYALALQDLGINRGLKKSKAKHEDVKSFYAEMNNPAPKPQLKATKKKESESYPQYIKRSVVENVNMWAKRARHYQQQFIKQKAKTAAYTGIDPDQAKLADHKIDHLQQQNAEQERQLKAFRERLGPKSSITVNRIPKRP